MKREEISKIVKNAFDHPVELSDDLNIENYGQFLITVVAYEERIAVDELPERIKEIQNSSGVTYWLDNMLLDGDDSYRDLHGCLVNLGIVLKRFTEGGTLVVEDGYVAVAENERVQGILKYIGYTKGRFESFIAGN